MVTPQPLDQPVKDPVAFDRTQPMEEEEVTRPAENEAVQTSMFTWTIKNFSQQTNIKLYSDTFEVNGYKWRVLIFPKGNKVDHLSIYLAVADSSSLPYGWCRHAEFSLAVVNQRNKKFTLKKDTQHMFCARESDWGFTSFMPINDLHNPSRGFLMNNTCIIQADITERNLKIKVKGKRKRNDSPSKKQVTPAMCEKVWSPPSDIICVQGYKVKSNIAPILEAIFKKYGDIAAECVFKPASTRSSLLESVCEVVQRIETTTIVSDMEEIESQVSALEGAKINISWLKAHLEAIHKRKVAILVKRAAQMDLKERCAELMDAQQRFEKAERCVRVLDLVEKKLRSNNILESKLEKDSWKVSSYRYLRNT